MKKKFISLICAVTLALSTTAVPVSAAETLTNPVKIGGFTYFDLNQDGANEKIGIFPTTEGGVLVGYTLRINDKQSLEQSISVKKKCNGIQAWTVDTKSSDSYTDLCISQYNEKGCFDGNVYRFDGKKLKKIYSIKNVAKLSDNPVVTHEQPGNGKIRFTVSGYPVGKNKKLGEYEIYMDFKISDKKIVCKNTTFTTTEAYQNDTCLEAYRSFKVYKNKDLKKKSYTIHSGEKFYITKIVVSNGKITYLQIKNTDQKKGWIKAPTKKFIK